MIITLIIYLLIILYIIIKGFYDSIKFFHNERKIELLYNSIFINSIPFYINMQNINLLCIFINLILISFIFLPNLMTDLIILISNSNIAYCQDSISDEESSSDAGWARNNSDDDEYNNVEEGTSSGLLSQLINETYEISNINRNYIYNINSRYIEINDHLKVFQGLSQNFEDIFFKQNILLKEISSIKSNFEHDLSKLRTGDLYEMTSMYQEIDQKCQNTLSLTSNAYNKMILSYNHNEDVFFKILNNKINKNIDISDTINPIIKGFIGYDEVENLNKKAINCFNALEEVQCKSEENSYILINELSLDENLYIYDDDLVIEIPKIKVINIPEENKIKNFNELFNYSNEKLLLTKNMNIHDNLDTFHKNLICKNNTIEQYIIMHRGFFFKEIILPDISSLLDDL